MSMMPIREIFGPASAVAGKISPSKSYNNGPPHKKKMPTLFFRDCFHHKKAKKKSLFSAPACNQDWYLLIVFICFFLSSWFLVRFLSFDFRFVFKIVFEFTFRKL